MANYQNKMKKIKERQRTKNIFANPMRSVPPEKRGIIKKGVVHYTYKKYDKFLKENGLNTIDFIKEYTQQVKNIRRFIDGLKHFISHNIPFPLCDIEFLLYMGDEGKDHYDTWLIGINDYTRFKSKKFGWEDLFKITPEGFSSGFDARKNSETMLLGALHVAVHEVINPKV